jgi:hypothetical protein
MEQDLSSRPDFPAEITTAPVIERSVHSRGLDLTGQQSANNPKPSTGSWLKSITFALFCTNQWMLYLICYLWQDSCGRPQVMALAVHMLGRYMGSHTQYIYICIYVHKYTKILAVITRSGATRDTLGDTACATELLVAWHHMKNG